VSSSSQNSHGAPENTGTGDLSGLSIKIVVLINPEKDSESIGLVEEVVGKEEKRRV